MANQTLSPRALRRIWSQLPPPTRRRLIAQLVFLLRSTDSGAVSEPIGYPVSAPQPSRRRIRAAIDSTPGGGLDDLAPDPGRGRVGRHVDVYQLTPTRLT